MATDKPNSIIKDKDALELYKHEDNLNWTKLNHLIISTAAIATGIGVLFVNNQVPTNSFIKISILLLFILGFFVILGFMVALWAGVENVKHWKNEAIVSDEKKTFPYFLDWYTNLMINESPTRWVLRIVPFVFLVLWLFAFKIYCFKYFSLSLLCRSF